jgi:Mg2+ and Co2+ transporter CorA
MPRRKLITIYASNLDICEELINKLRDRELFKDCDFDTVMICAMQKELAPTIKDVEKPIIRLERFILNNGNRNVGKQELCRIIKISRPTLNKWLNAGFISEGFSKKCSSIQTFDLQKVAFELEKYKKNA